MKSLQDKITELERIANIEDCDGDCDLNKPYIKCKECEAKNTLNEIGELIQFKGSIREVEQ